MAVLKGNSFQDTLCMPLVFGGAAFLTDVKLRQYLQNGEVLGQCQLNSQQRFDYDAVFVYGDNCVEAEALGAKVYFPENAYPYLKEYILEDPGQLRELPVIDPRQDGRMPELLRAAEYLRTELGDHLPIVGVVLGPMSIASQLMGLERLLYLLLDSPCEFENVIKYTSEISQKFGMSLLAHGVHMTAVIDPSASESIIPGEVFVRYLLPHLRETFAHFREAGALACWLMITGNTQGFLPYYGQCGIEIASIDYEVPLTEALKWGENLTIAGNIKPYSFINKSSKDIFCRSQELIHQAMGRKRFILSSGCEIPLDSKPENLAAFVRGAKGR
ncbi:uroporphyrinogen decarboxylase family protein [Desulfitobacterium dichloroeliminans]|nr:uroporphyrinogen decarboxylase family protein [Desulfitobacterium dichloroeliminans]